MFTQQQSVTTQQTYTQCYNPAISLTFLNYLENRNTFEDVTAPKISVEMLCLKYLLL
jgi:hypothetical protein